MEIVVHSKKSLFQQKFQKKLYHFNRNFQFRSECDVKMIQLNTRSRSWTKNIRLRLPVLSGIRLRLHPKTSDSLRFRLRLRLRLRNPGPSNIDLLMVRVGSCNNEQILKQHTNNHFIGSSSHAEALHRFFNFFSFFLLYKCLERQIFCQCY